MSNPMTNTVNRIRLALVLALVAGVLAATIGLFGSDGPPLVSAQADSTVPTVSSIAITSNTGDDDSEFDDDGVYGIDDSIEVTVTFSEDVIVTGAPQLELDIGGGTGKTAEYESAEGSAVVFSYTVAEGDSDDDGIAITANKLTLNGGGINGAADNAADLSHDALPAQESHKVDGVRPTISSVSLGTIVSNTGGSDGVYTAGELLGVSVGFGEDVIVTGFPLLKLDFEGATHWAEFDFLGTVKLAGFNSTASKGEGISGISSSGPLLARGIELIFHYTVWSEDSDSDGVAIGANAVVLNSGAIKDAAGNDAVLTHDAVAEDANFTVNTGGL